MKLAIFDIDGTLTQTDGVDTECFVQAFADAQGVRGINTDWASYPHTTDSGIALEIFRGRYGRPPATDETARLKRRLVELLEERRAHDAKLFAEVPGARRALDRLAREPGWAVALATGAWRASAALKLEAAGLAARRELPAATADDGLSREEILSAAMSRAGAACRVESFERVVSVGDGLWDVRAASRLGLAFVGVGEGAETLRRAGATHVLNDLADYELLLECLTPAGVPHAAFRP